MKKAAKLKVVTVRPGVYLFKDRKGEWRWQVVAKNGRILADSGEGYKRRADCLSGLSLTMVYLVDLGNYTIGPGERKLLITEHDVFSTN